VSYNRFLNILFFFSFFPLLVHSAEMSDIVLHKAVLKNDVELFKTLLAQGVSTEQRDGKERTPIFRAAHRGYDEIILILLDANADPNAIDKWGNTPLFEAAQQGYITSMNLLIASDAIVDIKNKHTETPLYIAVRNNQTLVAKQFLKKNADPNVWVEGKTFAPLHYAAMRSDVDLLEALVVAGAQVNARGELGATPLHMSAAHGCVLAVEHLLANGANINAQTDNGATPLHYAVNFGYTNVAEVVKILLENGADRTIENKRGQTFEGQRKTALHLSVDNQVTAINPIANDLPPVTHELNDIQEHKPYRRKGAIGFVCSFIGLAILGVFLWRKFR
jgi:ankyrin repeat protein